MGKQVWAFIAGFAIALLIMLTAFRLWYRRVHKNNAGSDTPFSELEQLSKLTGMLAHEIKNPLSTVKINLKLAAEDLEDCDRQASDHKLARVIKKISIVRKEADRLEEILERFLRYISKPQLQLENIDINELVGDMIDFFSPQCRTNSITIRQGLYQQPLICKVDANMLKQAILNLFINAQQAMTAGGELMIRTDKLRNNTVIQISDTGCGIDAERLPDLFDVCHSTRSRGSGLGLPTVKRLIEAHNGTITVDSHMDKGTSFTIELPAIVSTGN